MNREQRRSSKQPVNVQLPKPEPRVATEINEEYTKLCAEAGQLQYSIKASEHRLNSLYARISELGQEVNERKKLDEEATKKLEPSQAV